MTLMRNTPLPLGLRVISFFCAVFGSLNARRFLDWVAALRDGTDPLPVATLAAVLTFLNGPLLLLVAFGVALRRPRLGRHLGNVWAVLALLGVLVTYFMPAFNPSVRFLAKVVFPVLFLYLVNTRYRLHFSPGDLSPGVPPQADSPVTPAA